MASTKPKGLLERLSNGETVVVAEGYLFEFERRGYLQAGSYVPEVVLDHPEMVTSLHREFVHAGSDVVLAFTYYGHREKMRLIGKEHLLEPMNKNALRMAREVADETGTLMAGNICNTNVYDSDDPASAEKVRAMFKEQIEWAVEGGADYIVAERFDNLGEAKLALECIKEYGKGLPAVVTMIVLRDPVTLDGVPVKEALQQLADAGADVVGFNCGRGPATMMPLLEASKGDIKVPLAAIPVPYRTNEECPNFMSFQTETGGNAYPLELEPHLCTRFDIAELGKSAQRIGVQYVGVCCGNSSHYLRALAESLGRSPAASKYSPDMSKHYAFGTDDTLSKSYLDASKKF